MRKQLSFLLIIGYSLFVPACIVPTYIGTSTLLEVDKKQVDKPVSNILIAGAGSSAARAFLENLSGELIKL